MKAGAPVTWAVFVDRDGVLTDAPVVDGQPFSPRRAEEMALLPGAAEAVAVLHEAGALVLVVTNQPDVARGRLPLAELDRMDAKLRAELGVDDVLACPHSGKDRCTCRKPQPGMLHTLAVRHGVDLGASWTMGDRWVDIAAGAAAGTSTILVERPSSWNTTSAGGPPRDLRADHVAPDVLAAATLVAGIQALASGPAMLPPE